MSDLPQTRAELGKLIQKLEGLIRAEQDYVRALAPGDHMRAVHERTLATLQNQLDACLDRLDELPD